MDVVKSIIFNRNRDRYFFTREAEPLRAQFWDQWLDWRAIQQIVGLLVVLALYVPNVECSLVFVAQAQQRGKKKEYLCKSGISSSFFHFTSLTSLLSTQQCSFLAIIGHQSHQNLDQRQSASI